MCKQAEREQESRKLVVLIDRVKRQLQQREQAVDVASPKAPVGASSYPDLARMPSRLSIFER